MNRTAKEKRPPNVKPVEHIEVSDKHVGLRLVLVVVFLLIAGLAFAFSLNALLSMEPGWTEISASDSAQSCASDFVFSYYFSSGTSSKTLMRRISALYSEKASDAYRIFDVNADANAPGGIAYLNAHINEAVTVDEALYQAFRLLDGKQNRLLFLAPVYEQEKGLFQCTYDYEAENFDASRNDTLRSFFADVATFASDPDAVRLELLADHTVRLVVREDYAAFAEENGIETFVDFFWMQNAFVLDYLVDAMTSAGYTAGMLASYDGYSRMLGSAVGSTSQTLFVRDGKQVRAIGTAEYKTPVSLVMYRNYPLSSSSMLYYTYEDGTVCFPYISLTDGLPKAAANELVVYAPERSCAEVLLDTVDLYLAESLSEDALIALADQGVYSVWFVPETVCYTENDASFVLSAEGWSARFRSGT